MVQIEHAAEMLNSHDTPGVRGVLTCYAVVVDGPSVWRSACCTQGAGEVAAAVASTCVLERGGVLACPECAIGWVGGAVGASNWDCRHGSRSEVHGF
jgi:hypothetical protein